MKEFNEKLEAVIALSERNEKDKERLEEIKDHIDNRSYAIGKRLKELDKQWTMVIPSEVLQPMFKKLTKRHPKYMGVRGLTDFFSNFNRKKEDSRVLDGLIGTSGVDTVKLIGEEYQGFFNYDNPYEYIVVSGRVEGLQNLCKVYLKCLRAAGIAEEVLAVTEVYLESVHGAWEVSPNNKWGENGLGVWIIATGMLIHSKQGKCDGKNIDLNKVWRKLFMLYFEKLRYSRRSHHLEQQYKLAEIYKLVF